MTAATPEPTVGEVMHPGVITCARTATATEVARIMHECRTDCLVILTNGHGVEHSPVVWGMVTRDDLMRPIAEVDPDATAEQLAQTPVVRARVDLGLSEARSLCAAVGVSHLLVIDPGHGTPLGVVSDMELAHAAPGGRTRRDAACTTPS